MVVPQFKRSQRFKQEKRKKEKGKKKYHTLGMATHFGSS